MIHRGKIYPIIWSILILISVIFANRVEQINRAEKYLQERGEVYFKFVERRRSTLDRLTLEISIDKVVGNEVYAYANSTQFKKFTTHNIEFQTLIPPSLLDETIAMADYDDPDLRNWTKYPTYDAYVKLMKDFEAKHPTKCKIHVIGKSTQGRDIIFAQLSDNVNVRENEPKFLARSSIHGDETAGYVLLLRMIDFLLNNDKTDPDAMRIMDSMEMWIGPLMNPDGTFYRGNHTVVGSRRTNPNNVDLNRNYTRLPGLGASAKPEKETIVCMEFEKNHNFVMNIDYHGGIECVVYPWSSVSRLHPDDKWWIYVSHIYSDLAQENSPAGYFTGNGKGGVLNGYHGLYKAIGTTKDYYTYYRLCRGNTLEVSNVKTLSDTKLDAHWDYNKEAMLAYFQEALNGIRGTVVDWETKKGIPAKVTITGHDKDSSHVIADLPVGNFYRPIFKGTYTLTFTCPGYQTKVIENVTVENGKAVVLDLTMTKDGVSVKDNHQKKTQGIAIVTNRGTVEINLGEFNNEIASVEVYSLLGKRLKKYNVNTFPKKLMWDHKADNASKGSYYLKVRLNNGKIVTRSFTIK